MTPPKPRSCRSCSQGAGIDATIEPEDEADALKVLVPENELETALDAIETLAESEDGDDEVEAG